MRVESLTPMMARSLMAALPKVLGEFGTRPNLDTAAAPAQQQPLPGAAANPAPATSVQMLVTLASTEPAMERRRRIAKDAERGIDALERLHAELLAGAPSPERLRQIADWTKSFEIPDDRMLAGLLSDIDLRVRVELAKFDIEA